MRRLLVIKKSEELSEKTLRQSGNERDESQEKVWWGIEKKNDTESWESQQLVLVGSEDIFMERTNTINILQQFTEIRSIWKKNDRFFL